MFLYSFLWQAPDLIKSNLEGGPDVKTQDGDAI
jgi:hypothetical protein